MSDKHYTEVNAYELALAMANAVLFASTDVTLPAITQIHLVTRGKYLVAESTDRYVALQHRMPYEGAELDVLVEAKAAAKTVKDLVSRIPASNRHTTEHPVIKIARADGAAFAEFTLASYIGPDTTLTAPAYDGQFPGRIDDFFSEAGMVTDEPVSMIMPSERLAKLAKISDGVNTKHRFPEFRFTSPGKPVQVRLGQDIRAVAMPVKHPS